MRRSYKGAMARKNNAPTPSDLSRLAAVLRSERPQPNALKLDEIKQDVLARNARRSYSRIGTSLRRRVMAATLAVCLFGISTSNAAASLLNWASGGSFGSSTLGYGANTQGIQFFFGSFGHGGDSSDNAGHHTYCPDDKESDHSDSDKSSDRSDDKSDDNDKSSDDNSDKDKYSDDKDKSSDDQSDGHHYKTYSGSYDAKTYGGGGGHDYGDDKSSDRSDKSSDRDECPTTDKTDHSDKSSDDHSDEKSDDHDASSDDRSDEKSDDGDKSSNDNSDRDTKSDDHDASSDDYSDEKSDDGDKSSADNSDEKSDDNDASSDDHSD